MACSDSNWVQRADAAYWNRRNVANAVVGVEVAGRGQCLAGWTCVGVTLGIVDKILTRKGAILALRFVDDGNVGRDVLRVDEPVEIGRRAVCGVASKPFRLDPEGRLGTFNHCPRGPDLSLPDGARGLDIHNDPELDVDEIVVRVGEERRTLHRASPLCSGVRRRDELWRDGTGRAVGCIIERRQIFLGGAAGCFWIDVLCIPLRTRNRAALVGIGLDQARIYGITFASD